MGKETDRKMEGASSPEGSERLSLLINEAQLIPLIGLGIYLVVRALKRIHALDRMIQGLKDRSKDIAQLVE